MLGIQQIFHIHSYTWFCLEKHFLALGEKFGINYSSLRNTSVRVSKPGVYPALDPVSVSYTCRTHARTVRRHALDLHFIKSPRKKESFRKNKKKRN